MDTAQCLRRGSKNGAPLKESSPMQEYDADLQEEKLLLCRACGFTITSASHAVEVNGKHEHTFFNPAGIIFEIACFAAAPGCFIIGEASTYFAWFKDHTWRFVVCGSCNAHLGWHFQSGSGAGFFGLIRNRLVEGSSGE
jgi:uncharacterized CHY-type Zn-finger protein